MKKIALLLIIFSFNNLKAEVDNKEEEDPKKEIKQTEMIRFQSKPGSLTDPQEILNHLKQKRLIIINETIEKHQIMKQCVNGAPSIEALNFCNEMMKIEKSESVPKSE
jgi:superfamily II helicase